MLEGVFFLAPSKTVNAPPTAKAPTDSALQEKEVSAEDPFVLSDDDDLVPDPEHDKFNLAN
jgi:hypothetical protein